MKNVQVDIIYKIHTYTFNCHCPQASPSRSFGGARPDGLLLSVFPPAGEVGKQKQRIQGCIKIPKNCLQKLWFFRTSLKKSRFAESRFLPFYLMIRHWVRKLAGSSFFFLDEKKRTKPASPVGEEKSRQNNACLVVRLPARQGRRASPLKAITHPLFCRANPRVETTNNIQKQQVY